MASLPIWRPLDPILHLPLPFGLGQLQAIDNFVATNRHPPRKKCILDGRVRGTTPLLLACHYGELESVKHIVESWGANVQDSATYYLRPTLVGTQKIEKASPLFVAAFRGHSKIVRYLLEKGASVTVKTSNEANPEFDGLTPLNGAVSEHVRVRTPQLRQPLDSQRAERNATILSLLEFGADLSASFKPSWSNKWCGVDTTMTLINHGMDLKQRDPSSGRTILHYWANPPRDFTEEESLTMVKILIEKGADVNATDNNGSTPIMTVAENPRDLTKEDSLKMIKLLIENGAGLMVRNNLGFTPVMTAVTGLGSRSYQRPSLELLDFLLERDDIAIVEKIEAMELTGANLLFFFKDLHYKAFEYLRRATHLRQVEGSGSYQKKLAQKSVGIIEWNTSDQLEHHIQNSTENDIKIQSLLVQLRIISSRSWAAVNYFFEVCTSDSAFVNMTFNRRYPELLDIYCAMLDTLLLFQPGEKGLQHWSVHVVSFLINAMVILIRSNPTLLKSEIMKKSIHLLVATDRLRSVDGERKTDIECCYSSENFHLLLTMLLGLPEMLSDLWGSLPKLFRHLGSDKIGPLLLPACNDYNNAHYFPIIRLLLQLGANVDTADEDGNRPLHLIAQADSEKSEATGCLLIGYGAQLFCTNNAGMTAVDLWIERNENNNQEGEGGAAEPLDLPDWCRTVPKLICLSARCIRVNKVPFEGEGEFFKDCHDFIKKH